jgi:UDP-N-acetylmuramyl pentapeptide phosphotransferase/UDP-N-acetylglucosamine-1-phosphate transferase
LSGPLALLLAAFAAAGAVVLVLLRHADRLPADTPNERSLHAHAVPRGGGLAIWAGFLPAALAAPPTVSGPWGAWLLSFAAVAAVSLADDARGVPAAARFVVHFAASLVVAALIAHDIDGPAVAWTAGIALAIVWGANLYNFMDGSDGLAAAMAIAGFSAYAIGAALAGARWVAFACIALACVPFLFANRPPARIFMGDVGAVPLGFLAASFGIAGAVVGWWPAWFPALAFLPFVADATVTLGRRALRREPVWQAHRTHYYQRLNALGAGHRGTLAIYGAAMLACAAFALACLAFAPVQGWAALAIAAALHLIAFAAIDYHWRKNSPRER